MKYEIRDENGNVLANCYDLESVVYYLLDILNATSQRFSVYKRIFPDEIPDEIPEIIEQNGRKYKLMEGEK